MGSPLLMQRENPQHWQCITAVSVVRVVASVVPPLLPIQSADPQLRSSSPITTWCGPPLTSSHLINLTSWSYVFQSLSLWSALGQSQRGFHILPVRNGKRSKANCPGKRSQVLFGSRRETFPSEIARETFPSFKEDAMARPQTRPHAVGA